MFLRNGEVCRSLFAYNLSGAEVTLSHNMSVQVSQDDVFTIKYTGTREATPGSALTIMQLE